MSGENELSIIIDAGGINPRVIETLSYELFLIWTEPTSGLLMSEVAYKITDVADMRTRISRVRDAYLYRKMHETNIDRGDE